MPYKNRSKRNAASRRYKKLHRHKHRNSENTYNHQYYSTHKEDILLQKTTYRHELKREALARYGNKCSCCNETRWQFLSIDHINGGGNKHRAQLAGKSIYPWLKENNYPKGFQILCRNCNAAKSECGICPHKENNIRRMRIHVNKFEMAKGKDGKPWTIHTSTECIPARLVKIMPASITEYKPDKPSNPKAFITVDGVLEKIADYSYIIK